MEKAFNLTLRVTWWMQGAQILLALPCTILAFSSLISVVKGEGSIIIFLVLFSFGYMCWGNALSTIQITDESVTVTVFYGRFRINWNEVNKILLNYPLIALIGDNKRVVLSLAFAGKQAKKLLEYFSQQAESRNFEFEQNSPFPITHQNARVWR